MNPIVSIVIPSFNKAEFIEQTLASVCQQTMDQWEAIVVDDGSTDGSWELIEKWSQKDARIRCFKREGDTSGGSVCRNLAIAQAKGEYLMFLDADDLLSEECLALRLAKMESHTDLDFGIFPIQSFHQSVGDSDYIWSDFRGDHLVRFLSHELPWHTMSPLWKTTFVNRIKGFNADFVRLQDVEFHTRALLEEQVKYMPFTDVKPTAFYRIDESRIVTNKDEFSRRWVRGAIQYTDYFQSALKGERAALKKHLCLTLHRTLNQILYFRVTGGLSNKAFNELSVLLSTHELLNARQQKFLKRYIKLYQVGLWKVKGFNHWSRLRTIRLYG